MQEDFSGEDLPYWGVIAPIADIVTLGDAQWNDEWTALWHILTAEEEETWRVRLNRVPVLLQDVAAKKIRVAMALRAVNRRAVSFNAEDDEDDFMQRMEWLDTWPGPLVDAAYASYMRAQGKPMVTRRALSADPNAGRRSPAPSGDLSVTPDTSPDAS